MSDLLRNVVAVARVPMNTKACEASWRVKQRNYSGSSLGDDWYYMLVWCEDCLTHHHFRK